MDEGLQDHCALVLTDTINFVENYFEITKIIPIFAAMLLTNIPKNMTTECINPHLPVPTTVFPTTALRFKLFFLVCLFCVFVNAQERKDGANGTFKISQKQSPIITNIIGWAYDDGFKKWAGYKNLILDKYKNGNNKVPVSVSAYEMSNRDNILSLKFKDVTINDIHYYALYLVTWECYFEYPEIFVGIHIYKNTYVFLFDDEEYAKLFNLQDDSICRIKITSSSNYGTEGDYTCHAHRTERALFEWFSANLCNTDRTAKDSYFIIKREGTKNVRFQFPKRYSYLSSEWTNNLEKQYLGYNRELRPKICDFSKAYFELPASKWNLLKIK